MRAAALLAEAADAGFPVRLDGSALKVPAATPSELLVRLRERKAELLALLQGTRCRHCDEPVTAEEWQHPSGSRAVPFADGTSAHFVCYKVKELGRSMADAERGVAGILVADPA